MGRKTGVIAGLIAGALVSVATGAHAQSKPQQAPAAERANLTGGRKAMQWQDNGRWGLKLDFQQPTTRPTELKDVNAGLSYKLSPRFEVGGTVNLGAQTPPTKFTPDEKPQPRVRLETTFRF
jgi:hypothetical protein